MYIYVCVCVCVCEPVFVCMRVFECVCVDMLTSIVSSADRTNLPPPWQCGV